MSEKINDGGPAFPFVLRNNGDEPLTAFGVETQPHHMAVFSGMYLRDYFAAEAMPEIYARVESGGFERVAKLAYELADAMLKARQS